MACSQDAGVASEATVMHRQPTDTHMLIKNMMAEKLLEGTLNKSMAL
jgi:hypothetical protein